MEGGRERERERGVELMYSDSLSTHTLLLNCTVILRSADIYIVQ